MYFTMGLCSHSTFPFVSYLPKVRKEDMQLEVNYSSSLVSPCLLSLSLSPVVLLLPASGVQFQGYLRATQLGSNSARQSFPNGF